MLTEIDTSLSALPPPFDLRAYREHNPGLMRMSDAELAYHYQAHGHAEGRVCSEVHNRQSCFRLVPFSARILELGPFWAPAFRRPTYDVTYLDVHDTDELQRRADLDPSSDGARVPQIDHVWRGEPYRELVQGDFDVVFSSHNIEHQPNLVAHLRDVAGVLRPSGMFVLVIPDKRYCFDHFLPSSDITEVLEAHAQRRTRHAMANVMADQMMHTHNDALRHWQGDHGSDPRYAGPSDYRTECILKAMAYQDSGEGYVDAHAWRFTPDTFDAIITELHAIKMVPLQVARIYPTVYGSFEFYALLQRRAASG